MKDGSVYEYEAPVADSYDTSKTYLIEMKLNFRRYKFKSIKSRLRVSLKQFRLSAFLSITSHQLSRTIYQHEEELERKRLEEEERKKKEAEERRLRGIDDAEDAKNKKKGDDKGGDEKKEDVEEDKKEAKKEQVEEEPEQKPKVDEWKPYIPETPSKIHWAQYSSPDTFWLSMDSYDAGYLYECKFLTDTEKTRIAADKIDEPFGSVAVQKTDLTHNEDIPLTYILYE